MSQTSPAREKSKPEKSTKKSYLEENRIYHGDARGLLAKVKPESVGLSFWSPPYFVGKSYEKGMSFEQWKALLEEVIRLHFKSIIEGGFLAINIADILCFPDPRMPKIQANNLKRRRCKVTREDILAVLRKNPSFNRYQLADALGCSEQTIDRRLKNNNVRGGKYSLQTRVKVVGGLIEEWASAAGFYLYDRRVWVKDPAWENSRWHSLSYRSIDEFEYVYIFWKPGITTIDRDRLEKDEWRDWGSRAVWHIPSVRANDNHEAKFPLELAWRVIRLFSAEGDLVIDPFIGSGTTAVAAIQSDRRYMGFDKMEKYVKLAEDNCLKALGGEQKNASRSSNTSR